MTSANIKYKKKAVAYDVGNPVPGLGHVHICGGF